MEKKRKYILLACAAVVALALALRNWGGGALNVPSPGGGGSIRLSVCDGKTVTWQLVFGAEENTVRHLDETVMQAAASQFVGTHDFRAVRSVGTETRTTVRTVYYFDVKREGDLIECKVCANGFLYNMVRAMVGTIVYAAEGKLAPEDIPAILESGNRTLAGPTVPPGGLYMTKLWYDEDIL